MSDVLEEYNCLNCGKLVKVPMVEPYKGKEKPSGIILNDYEDEAIGVLCWDCAEKLCREGFILIACGGYLEPEAYIVKDFPIKHPEFLFDKEDEWWDEEDEW